MSAIKDRKSKGLTKAKDLKNRWQEHIEELYKKDHDPDNHYCVITHPEPDILESEVRWAYVHYEQR